jgi:hypothetical protein
LHFQQLFTVLELAGVKKDLFTHVDFGLFRFPEGKMSTRKGNVIFLEEVLDKAVALARKIIEEKNPALQNKEDVAKQVGVGAILFADLSADRVRDVEFSWQKMLSFEAGSFLILGALAAKELTITHCVPEHLEALIEMLEFAGVEVKRAKQSLSVSARVQKSPPRSIPVKTHEYPGFPTDLQAPMTVFLTQSKGENIVFETIFEGRLNFTEGLNRMGAQITMMDPHRVLVKGPTPLRGKRLESPDLRAGLAFIIAAIIAEGTSEIFNVYYVDRGYEHVEERLRSIGVQIERCTVP